jgi:quinol monooxygenase YgiN
MRLLSWVMLGLVILGSGIQAAQGKTTPGAAIYLVTYFDIIPADSAKAITLLRPFAQATRKEDGNVEFTLLDEIGRSGRMAMIEAWHDKAALEAHRAAAETLANKLQPFFAAPFDTRQFLPLSIGPRANSAKLGSAVYVLTHIDVFPAGKDKATELVKGFAEASRNDQGVERFDALVWDGHPNHFHLIEAWTDLRARQEHADDDQTKTFRANLVPLEGALYDERLYKVVR